jgi:putative SOS response-associated peptidase YedK
VAEARGGAAICNLYRIRSSAAEIAALFEAADPGIGQWKPDIYPRYEAPVIRMESGRRTLELMAWGFPRQLPGKTKMLTKHITNARNLASPFWRAAIATPVRRCLVPFTQFAEPKPGRDPDGRPAQHWFHLPSQPIAAFAGLWRPGTGQRPELEAGADQPGQPAALFAFATCEPNSLVAPLHPKAMPVILLPEDWNRWLTGTPDEALALQAPFPSQLMVVA